MDEPLAPVPIGNTEHYLLYGNCMKSTHDQIDAVLAHICFEYFQFFSQHIQQGKLCCRRCLVDLIHKLQEVELTLAKIMAKQCRGHNLEARTTNISYKATSQDVHIYIENLYPKEDRQPTRIMDQIEWSQLLGMQTSAVEGDIDSLDLASALDFTHIGLYPDATKEWHEANQIKVGKEHWPKLQNIWLQIEAIMILRPNLMQNILKHNLNEFEKWLYEDYPKTKSEENDQAEKQSKWYKE